MSGRASMTRCLAVVCLFRVAFPLTIHGSPRLSTISDSVVTSIVRSDVDSHIVANVDSNADFSDAQAIKDMEVSFARSEEVHKQSMAEISATLTLTRALEVLENSSFGNSSLLTQVTAMMSEDKAAQTFMSRRQSQIPSGFQNYNGLAGAKKMLNEMIYESMSKYDAEIAKCTEYYSKQCAELEAARGSIAASNFVAASSRALILDAQAIISQSQKAINKGKSELGDHNDQCKKELKKMKTHLKKIMNDIAVMTYILTKTDCDRSLLQMNPLDAMMLCEDPCAKGSFVAFNQSGLQHQVSQLQASSQTLLRDALVDMFDKNTPSATVEFTQTGDVGAMFYQSSSTTKKPKVKKTKFNRPPVPQTKVPGNPCTSKTGGAPGSSVKRAAKCTLNKGPQCYKLQKRFLLIQSGIADQRDSLMDDIADLEKKCKDTANTMQTRIDNDANLLSAAQTKLAASTQQEASAQEDARQTSKQNDQLDSDLKKQMKTCTANYIEFETESCSLKKVRGELYKKAGKKSFFVDCELSKWSPEQCSKKCAGGKRKLTRSVLTHPNGGAKCLPLKAMSSCNDGPCPVDCVLKSWSGWSKCSADCGGGVTQRVRDVKVAMRYSGKPCGAASESKSCNVQACEKDCVLSKWTKWSGCSKDCDGGTKKRQKFVKSPALGSGKCAGAWHKDRLEYTQCNMKRCKVAKGQSLKCKRPFDVILLIDMNPDSGKATFEAQIKAAKILVDAFEAPSGGKKKNKKKTVKSSFAVVAYGGPRTWGGVSACTGKSKKKVDMAKTCKIEVVQHFTSDSAKVKSVLSKLQPTKGSKLISLAFQAAKAEMALGSKTKRTVTIVFNDGRPLSFRRTKLSAAQVRKASRLHWVTVDSLGPKDYVKKWATRRWQENIVSVKTAKDLKSVNTITHVIANICPAKAPKVKFSKKR